MALEEESSTPHPSIIWAKLANDLLGIISLEVSERWEDGEVTGKVEYGLLMSAGGKV
jgi:hypothetical protein